MHLSIHLCFISPKYPPCVFPPSPSLYEVVLHDVQAAHHLGEDEHLVSPGQQFGQQLVDQHQLPGRLDHGLQLEVQRVRAVVPPEAIQNLLLRSWKEEQNGEGGQSNLNIKYNADKYKRKKNINKMFFT